MKIISRNEARASGLKRFFTGKPCKNNHISEHITSSSCCMLCDREKSKRYRSENPDKYKETNRRSRLKHLEKRKADNKKWREENKERLKESKRAYVLGNREKVAAAKAKYYQENKDKCLDNSRKHHAENKEYYAALNKKWRENNRDKVRLNNRNRKKKIREAEGSHTLEDIKSKLFLQKRKCAACYKKLESDNYHVDHIVPLALGGDNNSNNIQILCPPCNMSKGAKPPEEFYANRGFLL